MTQPPPLSLADWIVLTLIDEGPKHGFAVAALTGEQADVGRAWHVPRPIVYRCVDRLVELGLIRVESTEAGRRGPQRSVMTVTASGGAAVDVWLRQPVAHVRDVRSELLVKLALLLRREVAVDDLIAAQREVFAPVQTALEKQRHAETGFGEILASWRVANVQAVMHFLDGVGGSAPRRPAARGRSRTSPGTADGA